MSSFAPITANFEVFIGATFSYAFELLFKEGKTPAVPLDVLGWTAVMPIVPTNSKEAWKTLEAEHTPTGILFGEPTGAIEIVIADIDTLTIPWKRAKYELLLTNPDKPQTTYAIFKGLLITNTGIPPGILQEP